MFAKVILPNALNEQFTYTIPYNRISEIEIGKRVVVEFGKNKQYTGIVWELVEKFEHNGKIKPILDVLDHQPMLSSKHQKFWNWISDYYLCGLGEVMKAGLPSSLRLESEIRIYAVNNFEIGQTSGAEILVLEALQASKFLTLSQVKSITGLKSPQRLIQKLAEKGMVEVDQALQHKFKAKTIKYYTLNTDLENEDSLNVVFESLKRAPGQQRALMTFLELKEDAPEITRKTLISKHKISAAILKALENKGIIQLEEKEVSRLDSDSSSDAKNPLNLAQQEAYDAIQNSFLQFNTTLLHGVTSSGKTEIYIHLIEQYIQQSKQVLYLLPEIALTTQMVMRLKRVFGEKIVVYHSKYNDGQRAEVYQKVRNFNGHVEDAFVVLGARSSVLLPFNNLGLVIVDEEHEHTYKQMDPAPRYHARDAAIVLAKLHDAKTLLGTATPSFETYYNVHEGKFGLVELFQRHNQVNLPEIKTIDLTKAEKRKQMHTHFSGQLLAQIDQTVQNQEQVIIFQNRRGYAPYLECFTCNWVPYCEQCDVSLTYHQKAGQLICHYCGFSRKVPHYCDACGEHNMQTRGFGTEKIEDELQIILPKAVMKRLDLDATRSKQAFEKLILAFEQHEVDVLIGTQMVTKGLDFDNVKLVGVMDADSLLNYPDFRSGERSFQLMSQVSGRAGRKHGNGLVVVQTTNPKHPIIQFVLRHDFKALYAHEMEERQLFKYPPYYRLIEIRLKSKNQMLLNEAAKLMFNQLNKSLGNRIIGPENPVVSKIQNWHQKNILLKLERSRSHSKVRNMLKATSEALLRSKKYKGKVMILFDVDPY